MNKIFMASLFAGMTLSGAAMAQTTASVSTDLNVRSGPGVQHPVIGAIGSGDEVNVVGCIESANWCEVSSDSISGWAYGDYLNVSAGDEIVALYPNREAVGVTIIEAPAVDETAGQDAAVGGMGGAAMGALIGGPVGAVAGAVIGGTAGAAANVEPTPEITTYVTTNTVEPIYLDGEVVVGASVPQEVNVYEIPDQTDYTYAQINGQTVLLDANDRNIVYIYR